MESGERRKPMPTGVLVFIELVTAMICITAGLVLWRTHKPFGPEMLVPGVVLVSSVPFTLGLLWNNPRTSGTMKGLVILWTLICPGSAVIEPLCMYMRHHSVTTRAINKLEVYAAIILIYYAGRAVGWLWRRRSTSTEGQHAQ